MKKTSFLVYISAFFIFLIIYLATTHGNSKTIKVLFIGNSLTSANNLPGMVADIAESHGCRVIYDSHTPRGAKLVHHASNPKVLQKIKEKSWDFVVFQEQSQYPEFTRKQLSRDVFPYARILDKKVENAHARSNVIFYMTMARRNGDPDNKSVSSELLTYEGMQNRVNRYYLEMGKSNGCLASTIFPV